ncbi:porphobilinogen synthase [Candidatus Margulisiibacteriota bacterium]
MKRFRHLRKDQKTRDAVAETKLFAKDFIYPYFIVEGKNIKNKIKNFKNVYHFSIDTVIDDLQKTKELGITKILLFGISKKYELIEEAIKKIKNKFPKICIITDVCLCTYLEHGHCGVVNKKGEILNDETLPKLAEIALRHARAGADIVAPSDMMDGRVEYIRNKLNKNNSKKVKIMSYAAKYASHFYGPFRNAAKSAPVFGDRKTYQMDFRNTDQALDEIKTDINEGADIVMVKPAHTYLDIVYRAKHKFPKIKIAAYHVSGEYVSLENYEQLVEVTTAIKRAGADWIISYGAKELIKNELI